MHDLGERVIVLTATTLTRLGTGRLRRERHTRNGLVVAQRPRLYLLRNLIQTELRVEAARGIHQRLHLRRRELMARAKKSSKLQKKCVGVEREVTVLPRASRVCGHSARQCPM